MSLANRIPSNLLKTPRAHLPQDDQAFELSADAKMPWPRELLMLLNLIQAPAKARGGVLPPLSPFAARLSRLLALPLP